jgi:hypothetical protein
LVALSTLFALTLGPIVLRSWDFSRPLLPATVVGACLLARRTAATDEWSPAEDSLEQPGDRLVLATARTRSPVAET